MSSSKEAIAGRKTRPRIWDSCWQEESKQGFKLWENLCWSLVDWKIEKLTHSNLDTEAHKVHHLLDKSDIRPMSGHLGLYAQSGMRKLMNWHMKQGEKDQVGTIAEERCNRSHQD